MFLAKNIISTADIHNQRGFGPRTNPIAQKCEPSARVSSRLFKACLLTMPDGYVCRHKNISDIQCEHGLLTIYTPTQVKILCIKIKL